jgi:hypothetical protein
LDGVHIIGAVLAKLLAGTLPTTSPSDVRAGESKGAACHACEELIEPGKTEYEVNIADVGSFRFHRKCFDTWDHERAWCLAGNTKRRPFLADAILALLENQRGQMFCASCLASVLGLTQRIDRALMSVEGRGARRRHERCSMCGRNRLVCGLADGQGRSGRPLHLTETD